MDLSKQKLINLNFRKTKRLNTILVMVFCFLVALFFIFLNLNESKYLINYFLVSVLGILSLFILSINYFNKQLGSPISLLAVLMLVHYAIPEILYSFDIFQFANDNNEPFALDAQIYITISFILILCVVGISPKTKNKISTINNWHEKRVLVVIIFLVTVAILAKLYIIQNNSYFQITRAGKQNNLDNPYYAFIMTFELFSFYALIIACIYYFSSSKKNNQKGWLYLIIGLFLFELIYWLPTGRKEAVANLLIFPFYIKYLIQKTFPQKSFILGGVLFLAILFPAGQFFRGAFAAASVISKKGLSVTELIDLTSKNSKKALKAYKVVKKKAGSDRNPYNRLSLKEEVAASIRIQKNEGLLFGETYVKVLVSLIPRFIWKNKPLYTYGQEFGMKAGMSGKGSLTSVAPTILGEGFINLGWLGGAVLLGIVWMMTFLYKRIYSGSINTLNFILLYMIVLRSYIYIGGDFAGMFSGAIKMAIFFYLIGFFMSKHPKKRVLKY